VTSFYGIKLQYYDVILSNDSVQLVSLSLMVLYSRDK